MSENHLKKNGKKNFRWNFDFLNENLFSRNTLQTQFSLPLMFLFPCFFVIGVILVVLSSFSKRFLSYRMLFLGLCFYLHKTSLSCDPFQFPSLLEVEFLSGVYKNESLFFLKFFFFKFFFFFFFFLKIFFYLHCRTPVCCQCKPTCHPKRQGWW